MWLVFTLLIALAGAATLFRRSGRTTGANQRWAGAHGDLAHTAGLTGWRRNFGSDPIALVDDPRVAAVTMMTAVAQSDGALSSAGRTTIVRRAMDHFGCNWRVANEMLDHARFVLADSQDPSHCFSKLKPLIVKRCNPSERTDLIAMLRAAAAADGQIGDTERRAINALALDLT